MGVIAFEVLYILPPPPILISNYIHPSVSLSVIARIVQCWYTFPRSPTPSQLMLLVTVPVLWTVCIYYPCFSHLVYFTSGEIQVITTCQRSVIGTDLSVVLVWQVGSTRRKPTCLDW